MFEPIARRTFLRGLGTALALPTLEGMLPTAAAATADSHPLRLAFVFVPNGKHMPDWTPATEGRDFQLPRTLESLAEVRDQLLVVSGLAHQKAEANGDGPGDHARCAATFLTGTQPYKTDGRDIRVGASVDQIAARHLGGTTRLASLEIGCESGPIAGSCDSGYSCAYSTNISWRTPTTPAIKEVNPRNVFDRLFGNGDPASMLQSRQRRDRDRSSVLDFVAEDARRLRRQLGGADRRKLEEYLDGVREVEKRIDHPGEKPAVDGQMPRPRGVPEEYSRHVRLMGDLMVLAFQTDATRVCSFMFGNAGSNLTYPSIEIREGHHTLSHHKNDPELQAKIARINRFHVGQLAYILKRLRNVREGNGTLLDNTLLVYGSGISDGNRHQHDNLPVLVAGRGGGAIDTGRHLRVADDTPLMNLYLSLLQTAGVPIDEVGDSTGPLGGLG